MSVSLLLQIALNRAGEEPTIRLDYNNTIEIEIRIYAARLKSSVTHIEESIVRQLSDHQRQKMTHIFQRQGTINSALLAVLLPTALIDELFLCKRDCYLIKEIYEHA